MTMDRHGRPVTTGTLVEWADIPPGATDELGIVTYIDADRGLGLLFSDGTNADCSAADDAGELRVVAEDDADPEVVAFLRELAPNYADPDG